MSLGGKIGSIVQAGPLWQSNVLLAKIDCQSGPTSAMQPILPPKTYIDAALTVVKGKDKTETKRPNEQKQEL